MSTEERGVGVKHSTFNTQHSTLNAQRSTLNAQRSTLNAQHSTFNTQQSTINNQHSTPTAHRQLPRSFWIAPPRYWLKYPHGGIVYVRMNHTSLSISELIDDRGRLLAGLIFRHAPISRWELHQRTGLHPYLVGRSVGTLLGMGIVCEGDVTRAKAGRPRIPLRIDPSSRHIVGLGLSPGRIRIGMVNLLGQPVGQERERQCPPDQLISQSAQMLGKLIGEQTLAVAAAIPGFLEPKENLLLLSSIADAEPHGPAGQSLLPLHQAAGDRPLLLDNDMHALAQRWRLSQEPDAEQVLLVALDDGRLGASLLVGGRPVPGCLIGAHELGHTRLPIQTERCFCGGVGCLERIFSTTHLRSLGAKGQTLYQALETDLPADAPGAQLLDALASSLVNAIHLLLPAKVVIVGPFSALEPFKAALRQRLIPQLMPPLRSRIVLEFWPEPCVQSAHTAAYLALAQLYDV